MYNSSTSSPHISETDLFQNDLSTERPPILKDGITVSHFEFFDLTTFRKKPLDCYDLKMLNLKMITSDQCTYFATCVA